jgi:uncharacterized protein YbjT (DUF2867 family)
MIRLSTILRSVGYLLLCLIAAAGIYLILMSGIYHTPTSFLSPSDKVSAPGRVLVVGGTRGVGLEIVRLLVGRGEDVTAMVRATSNVDKLNELGVKQVIADALVEEQVKAIFPMDGYETVISTLGTSSKDLPSRQNFFNSLLKGQVKMDPNKRPDYVGNRYIIDAASASGVNRFIFITVIGPGNSYDALPLPARRGHNEVIPLKEKAEEHLRASGLAYTIIRPGGLSNGSSTGEARLTDDPLAFSYIARKDVAKLTIEVLNNDESIGHTYTAYDTDRLHLYRLFTD